jgi:type VI secretion system protein ImpJ
VSDYTQKVVWDEGTLLAPQHLQQAERYLEATLRRRLRAIRALDWGLLHLRIDTDALQGGELSLVEGAGVMPDGESFLFPTQDAPPPPRPVEQAFPPGAASVGVYVALPRARPGDLLYRPDATSDALTPFDVAPVVLKDEASPSSEREVRVARKRLRVLFTSEPREAYSCLPVAVLRRTATGAVEADDSFIPPCQYASASPRLLGALRRVLDIMAKRADDLSKQRRQRGDGLVDLGSASSAQFWFLHTLNSHLPGLRALFQQPRTHPFELYRELAALAGALYTFSAKGGAGDVPQYQHDDLTSTFLGLEGQLLELAGAAMPTKLVPIPLTKQRELVHTAQVNDERLLGGAKWVLSVASDAPAEKVVRELPIKAKVSSVDQLDALVIRALPGLPIVHLETPPADVPVQAGRTYFQLAQQGDHWAAITTSRSVGVYVPAEFGGLKLELMAVKDA